MHVCSNISIRGNYKDFISLWNKQGIFEIDNNYFTFQLPKQKELYVKFKSFFSTKNKDLNLSLEEQIEPFFSQNDFSNMDKLLLWPLQYYERIEEDIAKSYSLTKCVECGGTTYSSQNSPLIFSDEVFEDEEEIDPLDNNITINTNMFITSFGELIVNEKLYKITKEADIKGCEFEKVIFKQENCPTFYQVIIKHCIGNILNPNVGETCKKCERTKMKQVTIDHEYIPFDSCPNINLNWRLWAHKFKHSSYSNLDILKSEEGLDWSYNDNRKIIISPKYYELMVNNNITDLWVEPIELV